MCCCRLLVQEGEWASHCAEQDFVQAVWSKIVINQTAGLCMACDVGWLGLRTTLFCEENGAGAKWLAGDIGFAMSVIMKAT